jgi:hypothetical protein
LKPAPRDQQLAAARPSDTYCTQPTSFCVMCGCILVPGME